MRLVFAQVAVTLACFSVAELADAQAPVNDAFALRNFETANAVLRAGVDALGGEAALRGLHSVRRHFTDRWMDPGQQLHPWRGAPDPERQPVGDRSAVISYVEYDSPRWARSQHFDSGPGEVFTQVDGADSSGGFSTGRYYDEPPFHHRTSASAGNEARLREIKRHPEGLLRLALDRLETVSWLGVDSTAGGARDVVSFADPQGGRTLLYFDRGSHLLAQAVALRDHPVFGDASTSVEFSKYRRLGALTLPYESIDRIAGYPTHVYDIERIAVDEAPPTALFNHPTTFAEIRSSPESPTLSDRGRGVFEIHGPYNVMFAVFRDYVLLVEAPVGEAYVKNCLDLIGTVAPGKPVRAVSTHFHFDHIAGVRALTARGIPILTTADARMVIEEAVAARKTIRRDQLAALPARRATIEIAGAKTVFDDGDQRVEIYDVGPMQHVSQMLVAYFPHQKSVLVADLWDVTNEQQAFVGTDGARLFERLKSLGLEVERMVPVHGVPASASDLRRGLDVRARHLSGNR